MFKFAIMVVDLGATGRRCSTCYAFFDLSHPLDDFFDDIYVVWEHPPRCGVQKHPFDTQDEGTLFLIQQNATVWWADLQILLADSSLHVKIYDKNLILKRIMGIYFDICVVMIISQLLSVVQ